MKRTKPVRIHSCINNNYTCAQKDADAAWCASLRAGRDTGVAYIASRYAFNKHIAEAKRKKRRR